MKKTCILMACVLMALMLCACDESEIKGAVNEVQDTVSKYSQQIEDSKEVIEDGLGKMQGIIDEAKEKVDAN